MAYFQYYCDVAENREMCTVSFRAVVQARSWNHWVYMSKSQCSKKEMGMEKIFLFKGKKCYRVSASNYSSYTRFEN